MYTHIYIHIFNRYVNVVKYCEIICTDYMATTYPLKYPTVSRTRQPVRRHRLPESVAFFFKISAKISTRCPRDVCWWCARRWTGHAMIHRDSANADKVFGQLSQYTLDGFHQSSAGGTVESVTGQLRLPCSVLGKVSFSFPVRDSAVVSGTSVRGVFSRHCGVVSLALFETRAPAEGKSGDAAHWVGHIAADGSWRGLYSRDKAIGGQPCCGIFAFRLVPADDGKSLPLTIATRVTAPDAADEPLSPQGDATGELIVSDKDDRALSSNIDTAADSSEPRKASPTATAAAIADKGFPSHGVDDDMFKFDEDIPAAVAAARVVTNISQDDDDDDDVDGTGPAESKATSSGAAMAAANIARSMPIAIPRQLRALRGGGQQGVARRDDGGFGVGLERPENEAGRRQDQSADAKEVKLVPPHTLVENKFWSFAPQLNIPKTARAVRAAGGLSARGGASERRARGSPTSSMPQFEKIPVAKTARQGGAPVVSLLAQSFSSTSAGAQFLADRKKRAGV